MSGIPANALESVQKIGVFGGSFNPPHIAHVLAVQFALSAWPLDKVLVIPNYAHPLGKESVPFEHRFRMAVLAFEDFGERVEVSRIEEELGGVSFTIDTIRELKRRSPASEFHLIIGSDLLRETHEWKDFAAIELEAPPLVIPRLEAGEKETGGGFYLPLLSSTEIRMMFAHGETPGLRLPIKIADYIAEQRLY